MKQLNIETTYDGIEVKAKAGDPKSLKYYISNGFIHMGIVAKPSTGGHGDKFDTIPIYAIAARGGR